MENLRNFGELLIKKWRWKVEIKVSKSGINIVDKILNHGGMSIERINGKRSILYWSSCGNRPL